MKRVGKCGLVVVVLGALVSLLTLAIAAKPVMAASGLARFYGQRSDDDLVSYGEDVVIEEGDAVGGNVIIFGGSVAVEEGATVDGDVSVFGGNAEIDGQVGGNVFVTGGSAAVGATAVIGGEVVAMGGELDIDEDAEVGGARVQGPDVPRVPPVPTVPPVPDVPRVPDMPPVPGAQQWWMGPLHRLQLRTMDTVGHLARTARDAVLAGALAVLLLLALPKPMTRVSGAITRAPVVAGGVGFIGLVGVPIVAALMTITCVFIPVALGLGLAYVAALAVGWVAVGLLFGRQLLVWFRIADQPPTVAAALGALALTLLIGGIGAIPYFSPVSALALVALGSVGIGAVALTRFGARPYPTEGSPGQAIVPSEAPTPEGEPSPQQAISDEVPASDETKPGEGTKPLE